MKTKVTILLLLLTFIAFAPAFAGGWMIYHDDPYTGKIVDAETGAPIEGAAVVGIWSLLIYGGVEVRLQFFDAKEAITDKEGKFEVPSVTGFHWWPLAGLKRPEFVVFKPGYDSYPPYDLTKPGITGMEQKGFLDHANNLIKLTKLNKPLERKKVLSSVGFSFVGYISDQKMDVIRARASNLFKLINDEELFLGIK